MPTEDRTYHGHWHTVAEAHEFARWWLKMESRCVRARVHLDREPCLTRRGSVAELVREWAVTVTEVVA